jgi:flagellar biosynthesis chaperone FliJ
MADQSREIEFIVAQQAQFASDIQLLKELIKGQQEVLRDQQEIIKEQNSLIREQHHDYMNQMTNLTGVVGDLTSLQHNSNNIVGTLAQKVADNDERLNTLITMVERHMSGHV